MRLSIRRGIAPGSALANIVASPKYGKIKYKNLGPICGGQTDFRPGFIGIGKSLTIVINTFNDPAKGVHWNAGDTGVNARYLEHETGHEFSFLSGKNSSIVETVEDDALRGGLPDQAAEDRNAQRLKACRE